MSLLSSDLFLALTNVTHNSSFQGTFGSDSLLPAPGLIIGFFLCWADFHMFQQRLLGTESLTMRQIYTLEVCSNPAAPQLSSSQQKYYKQSFLAVAEYLTHCISLLNSLDTEMLWQPPLHFRAQLPGDMQFLMWAGGNRDSNSFCYTLNKFEMRE